MGRFLSTDPVDPAAGNVYNFNRYAYADNNPIKNTDPDGRCPSISDVCDAAKNLVRSVQNAAGKISGNAQSSSNTPTHASTSQRLAGESAADPKSDSVHMNQSLRTVTGDKSAPNIRPDVTTVNKDGSIDMVEVVSKGQTRDQMEDKLTAARQELGVPGNNTVVDPDPLPGMMVAPEPMSVPQPTVKPEGLPEMMTRPQVIEPEIFELP
jgi:hypothetical protein